MSTDYVSGPWIADMVTGKIHLGNIDEPSPVVASVQGYGSALGAAQIEAEGTARLIAATPELLEACQAVANDINGYLNGDWEDGDEAWTVLRNRLVAAIAKATGKPSKS